MGDILGQKDPKTGWTLTPQSSESRSQSPFHTRTWQQAPGVNPHPPTPCRILHKAAGKCCHTWATDPATSRQPMQVGPSCLAGLAHHTASGCCNLCGSLAWTPGPGSRSSLSLWALLCVQRTGFHEPGISRHCPREQQPLLNRSDYGSKSEEVYWHSRSCSWNRLQLME